MECSAAQRNATRCSGRCQTGPEPEPGTQQIQAPSSLHSTSFDLLASEWFNASARTGPGSNETNDPGKGRRCAEPSFPEKQEFTREESVCVCVPAPHRANPRPVAVAGSFLLLLFVTVLSQPDQLQKETGRHTAWLPSNQLAPSFWSLSRSLCALSPGSGSEN